MNGFEDLLALSDHFGILRSFHDFNGNERITSAETMRALLAAGADPATVIKFDDSAVRNPWKRKRISERAHPNLLRVLQAIQREAERVCWAGVAQRFVPVARDRPRREADRLPAYLPPHLVRAVGEFL